MQEFSPMPLPEKPPSIVLSDRTAHFLQVHAMHMDAIASYGEQLEESVFSNPIAGNDSKFLNKCRRVLKSVDAYKVLAIIWKESEFVSEEALAQAGLSRSYQDRDLTAHSLAADLSETAHDVSKLNSQIRTIGLAAATYRLVDRASLHSTKVVLKGSHLLHDFMSKLGHRNIRIMSKLVSTDSSAAPPTPNPKCG